MRTLFFLSALLPLLLPALVPVHAAPLPAKSPALASPADRFRGDLSLSGEWRFAPATPPTTGEAPVAPAGGDPVWGAMRVPGSWMRADDLRKKGEGPLWDDLARKENVGRKTVAGWYETTITVAEAARGRQALLDFARVSTDAIVFVDDTRCGEVGWPEGQVDITRAVRWGKPQRLRVYVVSTADPEDIQILMGILPGQNSTRKSERESAGLIGEVTLRTRPLAARIEDVFVQPSTRRKELRLSLSLSGLSGQEPLEVTARAVDARGRVAKAFAPRRLTPSLSPGGKEQTVTVAWPWETPRLWDLNQPNLYTLQVEVKGAGIEDGVSQRFGFREFWVDGRALYLNGTPFRMRPTLLNTDVPGGWEAASALGFNIVELWPNGHERRTQESRYVDWYAYADARGIPLTGILPHMDWMGNNYATPERAAALETQIRRDLKRYRNHPSIVMWGTSGNMMGATGDPRLAGLREPSRAYDTARSENLRGAFPLAQRGIDFMKRQDPTRPVFIHFGGAIGDLYTLNHYLNVTPLQEREEFISTWAKRGDMPLWYVEFGTPLNTALFRGRNGFGNAMQTEPFLSEYSAIYEGTDAYRREPPAYRADIAAKFLENQKYQGWFNNETINASASFQALQTLFLVNTWRSYRTMGMTGGMIPWDGGYVTDKGKPTPAGKAFAVVNAPTLAWITGDTPAFTEKNHHYQAGQTVRKQIALLNDSRTPRRFRVTWDARSGAGTLLGSGRATGSLAVGETRFLPVIVPLKPNAVAADDARIALEATIGGKAHRDTFAFRVFETPPALPASKRPITLYDPAGKTGKMLTTLGYKVVPWRPGAARQNARGLVVIGREAFEQPGSLTPPAFESFVRRGGRLLIFSHSARYLRKQWGLRVSPVAARRVWRIPSATANRWFAGLTPSDTRDWNGVSTLLAPYPDYVKGGTEDTKLSSAGIPYHGYHWGNRGSVSSTPIEKPHYGGWRPLFECEFDLAYSPVLTLRHGAGQVTLCAFDLEDHANADPAAARLTHQILRYAREAVLPRSTVSVRVSYRGDGRGAALLDSLGLRYARPPKAAPLEPGRNRLLIVGDGAEISFGALRAFARSGGRVLFLARRTPAADSGSGIRFAAKSGYSGSLTVPAWAECEGLSASDLRFRADTDWVVCAPTRSTVTAGADGLFAREVVGKGSFFYCQLDPDHLFADRRTYFRETRWRQTHALSQILSNLGGTFRADDAVFGAAAPGYYHADYRADFDLGDDPYREYNW